MSDEPKPTMKLSPVSEAFEATLIQFHEVARQNSMALAVLVFSVPKQDGKMELQVAICPDIPPQMEIAILKGTVKCLRYRLKQLFH